MNIYPDNPVLGKRMLPVDIVLSPVWWYRHAGITFDEDFFYNPSRRVEAERKMEQVLYERWGRFGLGADRDKDLPQIGAVHLAAGFLLSEMLGCEVRYSHDSPPQVIPLQREILHLNGDKPFKSRAFKRFEKLADLLKNKYGYLVGDVNFSGVLNLAMDLQGEQIFLDMYDKPQQVAKLLAKIGGLVKRFVSGVEKLTGTSSISVNRTVRLFDKSVFLHSECSLTMISVDDYRRFLFPIDKMWSSEKRPFGIHFCGADPHRFAEVFAQLPHLDFLDVGWGGNVAKLRHVLPQTFLNIRLSPVEILQQSLDEIRETIIKLVSDSANPFLTGVCCINMDDEVRDDKISAIFETVNQLRQEFACNAKVS
jgi:hypothetical protein